MAKINPISLEIVSKYCENIFFRSPESEVLLVFLPSVNGKDVYPYFPRKSWAEELVKKYNVLYISDPYQPLSQYKVPMGSWFISPDGKLTLGVLAEKIFEVKEQIGAKEVIFYGSSMGGYAAIILASLIGEAKAVAECPQLYLLNHPGSRYVCDNILCQDVEVGNVEPLCFVGRSSPKHIRLVCSIFDRHYAQHVLPFIKDIEVMSESLFCDVTLQAYMSQDYKKGHVAMNKQDALRVISEVVSL